MLPKLSIEHYFFQNDTEGDGLNFSSGSGGDSET